MFDKIAPRYDLVNRIMTFRLDVGWRRRAIGSLGLAEGSLVGDVGCGTGDFCVELRHKGFEVLGFDYSAGMLARARTDATLVQADALALPVRTGSLDGVTSGFTLRNFVDIGLAFSETARALRSGGRVVLLDVSQPENGMLRAGHSLYFNRVVPAIGGLLSDRDAYRYLPASATYLPPTVTLCEMLVSAGFVDVRSSQLAFGTAQFLTATRR
jgi:demethylmenaquinone methyltransferase/2-methoxy-6-polyprenyl-1,4-benzoquinol methylase